MHKPQKERATEIQSAIREILLTEWDPIGISDVPEAQDEYDGYIGGIYRLLASRCSADEMRNYLFTIATENMGLSVQDREHLRSVADRLLALDVSV